MVNKYSVCNIKSKVAVDETKNFVIHNFKLFYYFNFYTLIRFKKDGHRYGQWITYNIN